MSIAQIDNKYLLNARSDLRHGIYGSGSRKDMIRIVLRNGEGLNVSPANRKDFIKHLLSVNPSIEVAL